MASEIDMSRLDITKQNVAVEKVLERTDNPRHRYLLQASCGTGTSNPPGGGKRSSTPH